MTEPNDDGLSDKAAKGLMTVICSSLFALAIGLIMSGFGINEKISWGAGILLFLAGCVFLSWLWEDME